MRVKRINSRAIPRRQFFHIKSGLGRKRITLISGFREIVVRLDGEQVASRRAQRTDRKNQVGEGAWELTHFCLRRANFLSFV
jgi:hypothetical protein